MALYSYGDVLISNTHIGRDGQVKLADFGLRADDARGGWWGDDDDSKEQEDSLLAMAYTPSRILQGFAGRSGWTVVDDIWLVGVVALEAALGGPKPCHA